MGYWECRSVVTNTTLQSPSTNTSALNQSLTQTRKHVRKNISAKVFKNWTNIHTESFLKSIHVRNKNVQHSTHMYMPLFAQVVLILFTYRARRSLLHCLDYMYMYWLRPQNMCNALVQYLNEWRHTYCNNTTTRKHACTLHFNSFRVHTCMTIKPTWHSVSLCSVFGDTCVGALSSLCATWNHFCRKFHTVAGSQRHGSLADGTRNLPWRCISCDSKDTPTVNIAKEFH